MPPRIDYEGRRFRPVSNTPNGQVNGDTLFEYHQQQGGDLFTANYSGGGIRSGAMTGVASPEGRLRFCYQHLTDNGELRSGVCESTPEILADGRIRLHETWRWTLGGEGSGESIVEEDDKP